MKCVARVCVGKGGRGVNASNFKKNKARALALLFVCAARLLLRAPQRQYVVASRQPRDGALAVNKKNKINHDGTCLAHRRTLAASALPVYLLMGSTLSSTPPSLAATTALADPSNSLV